MYTEKNKVTEYGGSDISVSTNSARAAVSHCGCFPTLSWLQHPTRAILKAKG